MKRFIRYIFICTIVLAVASCGKREAKEHVDEWPCIFPDFTGVTVPHTIASLNFQVKGAEYLRVVLKNEEGRELLCDGDGSICMDEGEWKDLIAKGGDVTVQVSVWDEKHPDGVSFRDFTIHVSQDEIDPWVMYRLLPAGYEGWNKMGIYQRDISTFEEKMLVDNSNDKKSCMNCHSVANYDPDNFTYHLRGEQGGTIIQHHGKTEKIDLKALTGGKHGSHNAWHPSGRYIAFSSNNTKQIFYGKSMDKIEAFDEWSDLFIYDVGNKKALIDERFNNDLQWETHPTFSPDGKWLYFCIAQPVHVPEELDALHYDIVRCAFDASTGKLGDVDTIYNSRERGGTALMPRISPDGRFMLYTVAQNGAFNLYHKESEFEMQRLLPASGTVHPDSVGGETVELVDCTPINSDDAESFHAWSSNGHWMLFSSKRIDGRYTRLFIAHWDGEKWAKPFLLPQRDPEHNTLLMMAYNVGEFLKRPLELNKE